MVVNRRNSRQTAVLSFREWILLLVVKDLSCGKVNDISNP